MDEPRDFFEITSVSRDGRYAFFTHQDPKTSFDIYYMDLLGDHKVMPLLTTSCTLRCLPFSSVTLTSNDDGHALILEFTKSGPAGC